MYLGIEIGGTKLQLGVGPGDGTLEGLWRGHVDRGAGGAGIRARILTAVPELLRQAGLSPCHLRGVGVGFGGPVDDASGSTIRSHQIDGWDNFPLADWLNEQLRLPAVLGNDADVAGLGEALFGAGKGLSPVFYVTVGSGIGGGLIIDSAIYRGAGRGAAEIGHLRLPPFPDDNTRQPETADDILEHYASGWAIEAAAERAVRSPRGQGSLLARNRDNAGHSLTTRDVAAAATAGDPLAREILHLACRYLAEGLCHVIALLCPRRVVIGGGVSLIGENLFFRPLRELVAARVFRPFADCHDIVPAALGEAVVVHGALGLARQAFGRAGG